VFYPYHLNPKGTNLKNVAFRSPSGKDEISVIRRKFVTDQFCKDKAMDIDLYGQCRGADRKEFRGFAVISAKEIRQFGSDVQDSREVYVSHADIKHGFVVLRHEPFPAELNARLDKLKAAARFIPDPSPTRWKWMGKPLQG
jgi:hypothetical protein